MEYNIDMLVKTFEDHTEKYHQECLLSNPDYVSGNDFSLPAALLTICLEIKNLKEVSNENRIQ